MIFLYSDILSKAGGTETYIHVLALHLKAKGVGFRVAVAELERCPLLDDLVASGIDVYRQRRIPGDRWLVRQRFLQRWLFSKLKPGDWVYCVRQPSPELYLGLVRGIHKRQARIAVSWNLAPEFVSPNDKRFSEAVAQTDAVISVSHCTVPQYEQLYGYKGKVHVVPYHNLSLFTEALALPPGPPWKIGYLGRLERNQKNLLGLISAFERLAQSRSDVELHFHGGGPDERFLYQTVAEKQLGARVFFHGPYDHKRDLHEIVRQCHFFAYPSKFEGGPCFSLLELMQAGRFCVASRIGGIPDLYEDRPELGALVEPGDIDGLSAALLDGVARASSGSIQGQKIRARYLEAFDLAAAHSAWNTALGLTAD